jgi:hypothetical protein
MNCAFYLSFLLSECYPQQYIPDIADENDGGSTVVVVSLVIEIEGDSTV